MADLFNAPLGTATPAATVHKAVERFKIFSTHVCEQISQIASAKHLDETGFRICGKTQWLHVACTPLLAFYRVSSKRGSLLTVLSGCIVHHHWKPYFTPNNVVHALCNAHHLRELQALIDIEKEDWSGQMQRLLHRAHHAWAGKRGRKKHRTGHNLALRLREHKEGTLRFLSDPDVPFTNNEAEHDLRMMKLRQKISGEFRSQQGAEDFANLRSLITTARKQGWNIINTLMNTAEQLIADLKYA
jgi:transposase